MHDVITSVGNLGNFTIIRDGNLSVRHEGRKRWQSSFHKGQFTTTALPADYGPTIPVLGRADACNWPAMPIDEGSESCQPILADTPAFPMPLSTWEHR